MLPFETPTIRPPFQGMPENDKTEKLIRKSINLVRKDEYYEEDWPR